MARRYSYRSGKHTKKKSRTGTYLKIMLFLVIVIAVAGGAMLIMDAVEVVSKEPTVSFQNDKMNLLTGKSGTLKVKRSPENKKMPELKYSSTNTNVASVSDKGVVTARQAGNCQIVCRTKKGQSIKATVVVKQPAPKKTPPKSIFLTFDDGPGQKVTPKLLNVLKKYNAKATFFVIGRYAAIRPNIVKRELREGHAVGIHTYTHDYEKIYASSGAYIRDFNKTEKLLLKITGQKPRFWRFPGGGNNAFMNKKIRKEILTQLYKRGYREFDWNASTNDATGVSYSAKEMTKMGIREIKGPLRAIVLTHDSDAKKYTPQVIEGILKYYTKRGYHFLSLDDYYGPGIIFKY